MTRMDEYRALLQELERPAEALGDAVPKARKRIRRRHLLVRPLASLATLFLLFVLLVNFSAPVAYACSRIPFIRELAAAVTFSNSLSSAVENEYVQPIGLFKEENGVSASVEYLIVDQKQVNVFYRLDSAEYTGLYADPRVRAADGGPLSCSYGANTYGAQNGELQSMVIDFDAEDVPQRLQLTLNIRDDQNRTDYLAQISFLLEFDPEFTAEGKHYPVNRTVLLDGQSVTVTDIEVYPTHLRVNIKEDAANTAWLMGLDLYIETDQGLRFETPSTGIIATGSADTPSMTSYRADSTYFHGANELKLVITGATWLRKDMERVHVDLNACKAETLPEGVTLLSARRQGSDWYLTFEAAYRDEQHAHQLFRHRFYDAQGTQYTIDSWSARSGDSTFTEMILLEGYPHDEVWLCPAYSHEWGGVMSLADITQ